MKHIIVTVLLMIFAHSSAHAGQFICSAENSSLKLVISGLNDPHNMGALTDLSGKIEYKKASGPVNFPLINLSLSNVKQTWIDGNTLNLALRWTSPDAVDAAGQDDIVIQTKVKKSGYDFDGVFRVTKNLNAPVLPRPITQTFRGNITCHIEN